MEAFFTGDAMLSFPPGDVLVGFPYWDVGEIGYHGYVMLLPHAALPLIEVTHVRSREDPKGNVVTLR